MINTNWHISPTISKLSQHTVQILDTAFLSPPFGGLGTTYDVHLGLIGKCVVDFPLVLIEVFSLDVTAEKLFAKRSRIGDFAPMQSL